MLGIGFSLGGAILSKYMGESAGTTPFIGAVAVGAPYDLEQTSDMLESTRISYAYSWAMGINMRKMMREHVDTLALLPSLWDALELAFGEKIHPDPERPIAKPTKAFPRPGSLRYMDDTVTRLCGGLSAPYGEFPFDTAEDYYAYASSVKYLNKTARPFLVVSANDDPIVSSVLLKQVRNVALHNNNLVLACSEQGGHLGWFAGMSAERWVYHPVNEFIVALFQAYKSKKDPRLKSGLGSGGPEISRWKTGNVTSRTVEVEVLPVSALPHVLTPHSSVKTSPSATEHAWLLTKVLEHLPLVHPRDSPAKDACVPRGSVRSLTMVRVLHLTPSTDTVLRLPTPRGWIFGITR